MLGCGVADSPQSPHQVVSENWGLVIQQTMDAVMVVVQSPAVNRPASFLEAQDDFMLSYKNAPDAPRDTKVQFTVQPSQDPK